MFEYQLIGAWFLAMRDRACLWDEPGLGKTRQVIMAMDARHITRGLVVCPASLKVNWLRELELWGAWPRECKTVSAVTELDANAVNVCSYEFATGNVEEIRAYLGRLGALVLDEAHYVKNHAARRTRALWSLAKGADCVWLATGTPYMNDPTDIVTPLRLFCKADVTKTRFMAKYCRVKRDWMGRPMVLGVKNVEKLNRELAPYALRRTQAEVLKDLPDLVIGRHHVENHADMDESEIPVTLDEALRAKSSHISVWRQKVGQYKAAAMVPVLREWLEVEPVVLFAYHRSVIAYLKGQFPEAVVVDGSKTQEERQEAVDAFQEGRARLFIGQIQAAGTGLTLTAASLVVMLEMSWIPKENEQAVKRCHRIGQKKKVRALVTMLDKSADARLALALARKIEVLSPIDLATKDLK